MIILTKNDRGIELVFRIKNERGAPLDLSGTTAKFQLSDESYNNVINSDCTITDAANGICKYIINDTDLNLSPGVYLGAIEVNYTTHKIVSSSQFEIKIINECG